MELPTGTVTFLFTDIEGSTRLLQQLGDDYRAVRDDHERILRRAIDEGGGVAIRTEGDSFFAVFDDHAAAVRAAVVARRIRGRAARRCASGWASTPGAGNSAATTTSASTSTGQLGSPRPGTAGKCSFPRPPNYSSGTAFPMG
jgi:hypothetical protein